MLSQIILVGAASLTASFVVARLNSASMKIGEDTYSLKKYSYIALAIAIALAIVDICILILPSNASTLVCIVIAILMGLSYFLAVGLSRCKVSFHNEEVEISGFIKKSRIKYGDISKCMHMDDGSIRIITKTKEYKISDVYPELAIVISFKEHNVIVEEQSDDENFSMYMDKSIKILLIVFNCIALAFFVGLGIYGYNDGQVIIFLVIFAAMVSLLGIYIILVYMTWNIHIENEHITCVYNFRKKEINLKDIKYVTHEVDNRNQKVWRIYDENDKKVAEVFDALNNSSKFPAYLKRHGVKIEK